MTKTDVASGFIRSLQGLYNEEREKVIDSTASTAGDFARQILTELSFGGKVFVSDSDRPPTSLPGTPITAEVVSLVALCFNVLEREDAKVEVSLHADNAIDELRTDIRTLKTAIGLKGLH